ncbi:MAG: ATP-binding protein, partial [Tannerellaceae bacterium]|nr:ATP-binding protein [Tannerellaceae bacterium]
YMSKESGHITFKVISGYIFLIIAAICSVVYIFNIIEEIAEEEDIDNNSRLKVYLVTNTLSLLYESEALGQLIGTSGNEDLSRFNRPLNKARQNMDSLRTLVTDSALLLKIDTVQLLIEQKRWNTRRLLETWSDTNTERLYTENIERVIAIQDTIIIQQEEPRDTFEIVPVVEMIQDTVVVPGRRRGFFRRLADAFSPNHGDTTVILNTTRYIITDTLDVSYNPTDTIVSVLKNLQDSVADQRKQLIDQLLARAASLRYNNSMITSKINQILRDIEEEENTASFSKMSRKQALLRDTSQLIATIAVFSVVVTIIFLILILRDISRSKYYRKQLEKAKLYAENLLRIREKLMLTISHDIRAPLSSILGYIELLQRLQPGERQQYYLENMTSSSNHILSLVNDLLDYQRLDSGEMEIQTVPVHMEELFREIYDSFKPLAGAKGLDFTWSITQPEVRKLYPADPIRLRQIAGNLLSNAIKFTLKGKVQLIVFIEKKQDNRWTLTMRVSDEGPGIAKADQQKIFGEFTRLEATQQEEGFGLGLSITSKLIELMGGNLNISSRAGKGSDFTVLLPLGEPVEMPEINLPVTTVAPSVFTVSTGRKVTCLVIDDDPVQRMLVEEILKQANIITATCDTADAVLKQLEEQPFDVVLTDIQMPGTDGFRMLELIRSSGIKGTEDIPVIALSASQQYPGSFYKEAGFTGFLNKPFSANELISLLNKLLSLQLDSKGDLDFSSLTAFAEDDQKASVSILNTFRNETIKNLELLYRAREDGDPGVAAAIAHKLVPHCTMLKATSLVNVLKVLEEKKVSPANQEWFDILSEVLARIETLLTEIDAVISSYEA